MSTTLKINSGAAPSCVVVVALLLVLLTTTATASRRYGVASAVIEDEGVFRDKSHLCPLLREVLLGEAKKYAQPLQNFDGLLESTAKHLGIGTYENGGTYAATDLSILKGFGNLIAEAEESLTETSPSAKKVNALMFKQGYGDKGKAERYLFLVQQWLAQIELLGTITDDKQLAVTLPLLEDLALHYDTLSQWMRRIGAQLTPDMTTDSLRIIVQKLKDLDVKGHFDRLLSDGTAAIDVYCSPVTAGSATPVSDEM